MTAVLGIDVGDVRVGVAVSDPTALIASPRATLLRRDAGKMWRELAAIAAEHEVDRVVVGLPLQLNGSEGDAASKARAFAAELEEHLTVPIEWWDERFSTQAAERSLLEGDVRRNKRRQHIDAVAAALVLQSWLDSKRREAR